MTFLTEMDTLSGILPSLIPNLRLFLTSKRESSIILTL